MSSLRWGGKCFVVVVCGVVCREVLEVNSMKYNTEEEISLTHDLFIKARASGAGKVSGARFFILPSTGIHRLQKKGPDL